MASLFEIAGVGGLVDTLLGDAEDGFQSGFIFELTDSRKSVPLFTFTFVVNPTRYELSEPFQAELTPTEDNSVISEETGIITREILLEGTFGLKSRRGYSFNGLNAGASIGGTEHFLNLRRMFRQYSELKKDPSQSPYVRMVLHVIKDDDHFEVVPRELTSPRDSRTARVHRVFRMRLTAIDGPNFGASRFPAGKKGGGFFDKVADLSKALNDARAAFADTTAVIDRLRRRTFGNVDALMLQAAGVVTAVGNFVRGIKTAFIAAPIQLVQQAALDLETIADNIESVLSGDPDEFAADRDLAATVRGLSAALDAVAQYPEAFAQPSSLAGTTAALSLGSQAAGIASLYSLARLTPQDLADDAAGATVGTKTRIQSGSDKDGGLPLGSFQGVRSWLVRRTDSLASIANATSSDPAAIVLLNDLRYPYVSEGGGPGIAKPGDRILVPDVGSVPDLGAAAVPGQDDYFITDDVLFGADLALDLPRLSRDGEMELLVDELHGSDDAQLVSGVPNVVQGISITINSEVGTTTAVPDVGIRRPVGDKGTIQHTLLAAVRLRDGVLADDRVEEITTVSTVLDADVLRQEMSVKLIDGRTAPIAIPFGKASGAGSVVQR